MSQPPDTVLSARPDAAELLVGPVILVGCGDSGSTLFSQVLDAHPDVQFPGKRGDDSKVRGPSPMASLWGTCLRYHSPRA